MTLQELVARGEPTEHFRGQSKIPWNERDFSRRLLDEHLDQEHDAASRRQPIIDQHVAWIHRHVLGGCKTRVLDLCCGPGFYTARLARLGHVCVGVDFAPASIAYARAEAADAGLNCRYIEGDIRTTDFGSGYGLGMMLFGEFNTFPQDIIGSVLKSLSAALDPGGKVVLEPQRLDAVQRWASKPSHWYRTESGLFANRAHICLEERFWDEKARVATDRYYVIDAATAEVTEYINTTRGYTQSEISGLLTQAGFEEIEFHQSLTGKEGEEDEDLMAVCATRAAPPKPDSPPRAPVAPGCR